MTRIAPSIFVEPEDVQRLNELVEQLPINARVRIIDHSGKAWVGIVTVTPTVQMFRDPSDDREGVNGVVNLEDPQQPGWHGNVWLGDIAAIEHLDSVTIGSTRA
jgi:hypothetical protein